MTRNNSDTIARFIRGDIDDSYRIHTNVRSDYGGPGFKMPDDGPLMRSATQLISYATPIASSLDANTIVVNPNTYSISTTAQQSSLTSQLREYGYKPTGRTAQPRNHPGMMREGQWAWEIYEREELPELSDREMRAVANAIDEKNKRMEDGKYGWSKSQDRRDVRELHEMLEGTRKLHYIYSDRYLQDKEEAAS